MPHMIGGVWRATRYYRVGTRIAIPPAESVLSPGRRPDRTDAGRPGPGPGAERARSRSDRVQAGLWTRRRPGPGRRDRWNIGRPNGRRSLPEAIPVRPPGRILLVPARSLVGFGAASTSGRHLDPH